jgi:hypothetical protein
MGKNLCFERWSTYLVNWKNWDDTWTRRPKSWTIEHLIHLHVESMWCFSCLQTIWHLDALVSATSCGKMVVLLGFLKTKICLLLKKGQTLFKGWCCLWFFIYCVRFQVPSFLLQWVQPSCSQAYWLFMLFMLILQRLVNRMLLWTKKGLYLEKK